MTLGHGPKIITSGLVSAYDMNPIVNGRLTSKSWKGAPTFNASLQDGQNDVSPWNGDGTPTSLGIDSNIRFRGRKVAKFQVGTSRNCYINGSADLYTSTTSTVWTSTFYLKRVDNTPITSVGMYQYITNNTNVNSTVNVTPVENGWYQAVYTRSGLVAGYPSLTGMYNLGSTGDQYYFADWQCENNSFSTPWVSSTRSSTTSLLDWTGKGATITMNSPSYNASGEFYFNGGTERIDLTNIGGSGAFNNHFTISAWINSTNISATQNILSMNGPYFMRLSGSKVRFNVYAGNPASWLFQNGTTTLSSNTWYFLTMVWDGTANTWTGYINDQQEFSVSKTGPLAGNTSNKTLYGYVGYTPQGGEQSNFYGQIPVVYYYNTSLSAAQVQQNFNALRGRYGL